MDEVNTRCFSEKMPQLQFKSQKPQKTTNAKNQIDRYILRNAKILLFKHQRLSDLSVYVKLQRVSTNWIDTGQLSPTMYNINLTIKPGQLCCSRCSRLRQIVYVTSTAEGGKSQHGFRNSYSGLLEV